MLEGRVLHYRVLRRLGAGGMGEVYLAEDEVLGCRRALKFLSRADSADPVGRERLRREARSLASLSHPSIIGIHALEEHDGRIFLVMDFIDGETLADRIAKRPLPVTEVIERGMELVDALAHAHAKGVIHRDLKPTNIFIGRDSRTMLGDFGLALSSKETRLTGTGVLIGTVNYMSPEQVHGMAIDNRSDLFSFGIVLYEALIGLTPFARESMEAAFHAICVEDPEPPTALRSGVPLELERIVMKCLRKAPAERYQHAEDLAADLRSIGAVGASSTTGTRTTPGIATARRRLIQKPVLLAAGLILAAGAVPYLFGGLRAPGKAGEGQRTMAVLPFQQMEDPKDPRHEATMAASLLTIGLGESQSIPVLSVQRIHDVLRKMGRGEQTISGSGAIEVGRRAGATYVVTGYIFQMQPDVVVGAEVVSAADGSVVTSRRVRAPGGDQGLFAAVDSLTIALRDALIHAGLGVRDKPIDVATLTTRSPGASLSSLRPRP